MFGSSSDFTFSFESLWICGSPQFIPHAKLFPPPSVALSHLPHCLVFSFTFLFFKSFAQALIYTSVNKHNFIRNWSTKFSRLLSTLSIYTALFIQYLISITHRTRTWSRTINKSFSTCRLFSRISKSETHHTHFAILYHYFPVNTTQHMNDDSGAKRGWRGAIHYFQKVTHGSIYLIFFRWKPLEVSIEIKAFKRMSFQWDWGKAQ